jgi:hypothetical protein
MKPSKRILHVCHSLVSYISEHSVGDLVANTFMLKGRPGTKTGKALNINNSIK